MITGLKLDFSNIKNDEIEDKNKTPKIVQGKNIQPHRIHLIEQLLTQKKFDEAQETFFNFDILNYENALTFKQLDKEIQLFNRYLEERP